MDLIDRYLAAIARRLPADKAADIVAEIQDDLLSRIEAREEALGRTLDGQEVSALIKEMGHPLIVAARYRPAQYLIGPDAFPFFVATLRIVAMFLVVALAVGAGANVIFGHVPLARAFAQSLTGLLSSAMLTFGTVVAIFYALERTGFPADHLRKWRPEALPETRYKQPGAWCSAFEVATGLYAILWWCGVAPLPLLYTNVKGLTLVPDPIWAALWWPVLALMVARLVYNLVQWLRPRWKMVRGVLSVATAAGGVALLAVIHQAGHWLSMHSTTMSAHELMELDRAVNLGLGIAIVVVGVVWVLQCGKELWQLMRSR
ncbi:MAG: hypothetical protein JWL96_855 [Sphingomonas bacterium]|uniref:hypothetical protein n=1 Tax=Sphingomonas bacterium TaxID=1895847 RepID=UPI00263728F3|nr:hypothetical protein [Sphingomonas bacterium]MDB5708785.1 hypothetical protein [Sphingomonas bacterium]